MALESATFINDLVSTNPVFNDPANQGDDHVRLVKSCVKATFPNFTSAALTSTQAQIDASTAATAGTGTLKFALGSAGAPGIQAVGDPNTGIYSPGADQVSIATAGVQALRVNADQSVSALGAASVAGALAVTGAYSGGTGQLVPTGMTSIWWTTSLPTGYVWANGAAISRTGANAALFALFGTTFGVGDGSTTFNVPNLQDTAPIGTSAMGGAAARGLLPHNTTTTVGTVVGEERHTLTTAELAAHTHTNSLTDPGHTHSLNNATSLVGYAAGTFGLTGSSFGTTNTPSVVAASTGITINNASTGSGTAHNVVQPSIAVNWVIKL